MIASNLVFAFLDEFYFLIMARAIQGLGASFVVVTCMIFIFLIFLWRNWHIVDSKKKKKKKKALEFLSDTIEIESERSLHLGRVSFFYLFISFHFINQIVLNQLICLRLYLANQLEM